MIGTRHREAIGALQDQTALLQTQVATLGQQLAAVMAQVSAEQEALTHATAQETELRGRIDALEQTVAAQAGLLAAGAADRDALADELASLRAAEEQREEAIRQLRGQLARMERQATIDLDEMRRVGAALAASLLPGRMAEPVPQGDRHV